jgi:hypothetical protein
MTTLTTELPEPLVQQVQAHWFFSATLERGTRPFCENSFVEKATTFQMLVVGLERVCYNTECGMT